MFSQNKTNLQKHENIFSKLTLNSVLKSVRDRFIVLWFINKLIETGRYLIFFGSQCSPTSLCGEISSPRTTSLRLLSASFGFFLVNIGTVFLCHWAMRFSYKFFWVYSFVIFENNLVWQVLICKDVLVFLVLEFHRHICKLRMFVNVIEPVCWRCFTTLGKCRKFPTRGGLLHWLSF